MFKFLIKSFHTNQTYKKQGVKTFSEVQVASKADTLSVWPFQLSSDTFVCLFCKLSAYRTKHVIYFF